MLQRIWRRIRRWMEPRPEAVFPLRRPLELPEGVAAGDLRSWLATVHPAGAPAEEMARYCGEDFERFVLTWQLSRDLTGRCLEIGANPYFTTMLLRRFTPLELTLVNFFGQPVQEKMLNQEVSFRDWRTGEPDRITFGTHHFNVEKEAFPFDAAAFDVVLFCEVLEHLLEDPLFALREIHRVLAPAGALIVTTPNVARLENLARLLAGENLYDPYSGYGPYGRHNREYTLRELIQLLEHAGFAAESAFSADVHENRTNFYYPVSKLKTVLTRAEDLGQYLFVRAKKTGQPRENRPAWLFRSFA